MLFDKDYWTKVISFDALLEEDMIEPDDLKLFQFANSAEEVWKKLLEQGLTIAAKGAQLK